MVLNAVVRPAGKEILYVGPPITEEVVGSKKRDVLLQLPFLLRNFRVQMIVPPLPALLPDSIFKLQRNLGPVSGTEPRHEAFEQLILFPSPFSL